MKKTLLLFGLLLSTTIILPSSKPANINDEVANIGKSGNSSLAPACQQYSSNAYQGIVNNRFDLASQEARNKNSKHLRPTPPVTPVKKSIVIGSAAWANSKK